MAMTYFVYFYRILVAIYATDITVRVLGNQSVLLVIPFCFLTFRRTYQVRTFVVKKLMMATLEMMNLQI